MRKKLCQGDQCGQGQPDLRMEHYYSSSAVRTQVFRQIYQGICRKTCQARRKLDFDDMILYSAMSFLMEAEGYSGSVAE